MLGENDYGELGDGTKTDRPMPVTVGGIGNAIAVGAGLFHSCALLAGGSVECSGYDGFGQLGDGRSWGSGFNPSSSAPVAVKGLALAVALAAGDYYNCAILADGTVVYWGGKQTQWATMLESVLAPTPVSIPSG